MFKLFKLTAKLRVPARQMANQNRGNYDPQSQGSNQKPDFNFPSQNQSQKQSSQTSQSDQDINKYLEENKAWENMQQNQSSKSNQFTQQSGQQFSQPSQTSVNQGSSQMNQDQKSNQGSHQMGQNQNLNQEDQPMTEKVKETVENVMKMTANAYETVKEKTADVYEAVKEKVDKAMNDEKSPQAGDKNVQDSANTWNQSQNQNQYQKQNQSQSYDQIQWNQSAKDNSAKSGSQKVGDEADESLLEKVKEKISDTYFNAREKIGMKVMEMKEAITEPYSSEDSVKYSKKAFESAQGTHDPDSPFTSQSDQKTNKDSNNQQKK